MSATKRNKPEHRTPAASAVKKKIPVAWFAAIILVLTFCSYLPSLSDQKEFVDWDDPGYVVEQPLVKSLAADNIRKIFQPSSQVCSNYHPLTMLTLAWNYGNGYDTRKNVISMRPFIWTNLIIHLLNTLLVFVFILLLARGKPWLAVFVSLFFGIHPMHVESVAWISERKDVLYCFFFLLSCISYLRYRQNDSLAWLAACCLFFVLSCLSKAMAVPLPFVLLLMDFYTKRQMNIKAFLEKIPFLLLAVWFGYHALHIQTSVGAVSDFKVFSLVHRVIFALYGFMMYWVKLFCPTGLSNFYPYPGISASGMVPLAYMISPLVSLAIVVVPLYLSKRISEELFRANVLGMGFFILMVALVLQFISVGAAIMADRYTYLPYIGAFFLLGSWLDYLLKKTGKKIALAAVVILFTGFFTFQTYGRTKVWTNSNTLWTNVISNYPDWYEQHGDAITVNIPGVSLAYKNRALWYNDKQMFDRALEDMQVLAKIGTKDGAVWNNLGNLYALNKDYENAIKAYAKAVQYDSLNYKCYLDRGITYSTMQKFPEAIADMDVVLRTHPDLEQANEIKARALLNSGRHAEAIAFCNIAQPKFPNNGELYYIRGTALINTGSIREGVADLEKAIPLNKHDNGGYHFNLAYGYMQLGQVEKAREQTLKARTLGFAVPESFLKQVGAN